MKKRIAWNKGIPATEEAKRKLRETKTRNPYFYTQEQRKRMSIRRTGKKCSQETIENIRKAKIGEKNPMWKGDKASYGALHDWVKRHLPKPEQCPECGENKRLTVANISQDYKRDIYDWEWLCYKCHVDKYHLADIRKRMRNGTYCREGHLLIPENIVPSTKKKGWRKCLICKREAIKIWRGRRKAAGLPYN